MNFYDEHAKLGLHQDRDEHSDAPVVSLSLDQACTFRFGNTRDRRAPFTDLELGSGDLFVFGGPARLAYHGLPRQLKAPEIGPDIGLAHGRINITLRVTGSREPRRPLADPGAGSSGRLAGCAASSDVFPSGYDRIITSVALLDWDQLAAELDEQGYALTPPILGQDDREQLIAGDAQDVLQAARSSL